LKRYGHIHISLAVLICSIVLISGCVSNVYERGWIGGSYIEASTSILKPDYFKNDSGVLHALPDAIKRTQKGALLVTRILEGSPISQVDVHEGDLILKVNNVLVKDIKSLKCIINQTIPGSKINLLIYRNGDFIEREVIVGKETYRRAGQFEIGLAIGSDLDLIPNPDFSIFSLISYKRHAIPFEVRSPEWKYVMATKKQEKTLDLTEISGFNKYPIILQAWKFWFLVFGFGEAEIIISQEAAIK
jgi:hypothetical protein